MYPLREKKLPKKVNLKTVFICLRVLFTANAGLLSLVGMTKYNK